MRRENNKPTYVTRGNVLDDLGFLPEQTTALKFKAELYQAILRVAKKYSQKELQIILVSPMPTTIRSPECRAPFMRSC